MSLKKLGSNFNVFLGYDAASLGIGLPMFRNEVGVSLLWVRNVQCSSRTFIHLKVKPMHCLVADYFWYICLLGTAIAGQRHQLHTAAKN